MSLDVIDRAVVAGARGMNRRRFLRVTGGAALGVAFSTAFLSKDAAAACQAPYNSDRICGPWPYCNSTRCGPTACHNSTRHSGAGYGGNACTGSTAGCWCVCKSGNLYNCCDCCADEYQGGIAYCCEGGSCGSGQCMNRYWYLCVCRVLRCTSNCGC